MRRAPLLAAVVCLAALAAAGTARAQKGPKFPTSAIQVRFVQAADVTLPPEFQVALYENLVEEVKKTGKFERVYRDGERGAENEKNLLTLHSTVIAFKEGSERARQVTTVAGATKISVQVQISTRDGGRIVDRHVEGNVHFFGENLRATYDFAKGVAKLIKKNF
jgi:hypothetical protein